MDSKVLFERAMMAANNCIQHVQTHQLHNETPCTEWDLRQLLNHMVYEVSWVPDLLEGKTIKEIGDKYEGDLVGEDPIAAWHAASETAHVAIITADPNKPVHLSSGDVPAENYISEVGGDVLLHTWDVAQSMCCNLKFDKQLVAAVYHSLLPKKDDLSKSGDYGKSIVVPRTADTQTKLLGLVGRKAATV